MIRLCHIISGLGTGGAEMMLYKLLSKLDRSRFQAEVISMTEVGPMGQRIRGLGIPVRALGMRRGGADPRYVMQLAAWLRQLAPNVIQTWMYHADLAGGVAAKFAGHKPVIWGIRRGTLDRRQSKRLTIWTARLCGALSPRLPARIVCCSEASKQGHARLGYALDKMEVIPNGFDLYLFKPDPEARLSVRRELGLPPQTMLLGMVGRFHPSKDHSTFIEAAKHLHARQSAVHFVLCGRDVTWENPVLRYAIETAGLQRHCHLLGRRDDVPRLTAAFDIATLSSSAEGFPNVVGEAMACEVPCVVTDVGDAASIVGETGKVVPPSHPQALAHAWAEVVALGEKRRRAHGRAARMRVQQSFNLPAIVARYEQLYTQFAA